MEKKEIIRKLKEILSKHEGNTSEGAIYWDFEWVGGKQIPTGGGGYRQEGGKLVYKDKEFYQEMADFILQELDKARKEGKLEVLEELLEPMWDTPPEWKFMRLKTKMAHMMRDLLKLKDNK